ncbi:MAG: RNA-directed DNA polymerase, partial [Candidatus Limnocylindrus sp.]
MRLLVQPRGWSEEIVVPIPKAAGVLELGAMRPLKLLEVTKKAVMGILKARMRTEMEAAGVLSSRQCGFRQGYSCHIAALRLVALLEGARRDKSECHVVALDIAKAYDTVERGWGLGVALERLGVSGEVVEWLWAGSRDNVNWVRTGWEELLRERGHEVPTFHARTGFTQGAAESPLLWNVFYDMLLCQLEREGVGAEIVRSAVAGEGSGEGLGAFADDTVLVARSAEEMEAALRCVQAVFGLVGLSVAAHKSVHLCLRWVANPEGGWASMQLAEEDARGVYMGGIRLPQVDYDVGFRYLGVWIDGAGDWGEEQARVEEIIHGFCCTVEQLRVPSGVVLYLYKAVLTPRVLYKLTLAALTGEAIDELEGLAWGRLATRLGGWTNMHSKLKFMALEDGGLGLIPWAVQTMERRVGMITQLATHGEPWAPQLLEELRVGWARDRGGSDRSTLGTKPAKAEESIEGAAEMQSWMRGTDWLLQTRGTEWTPRIGSSGRGWREQDCELGSFWLPKKPEHAYLVAMAGLHWLSDMCDAGGAVLPFDQVPGWRFMSDALTAAGERVTAAPLGAWRGRAAEACGARPGSWVCGNDRLGWLRGWRKRGDAWEGGIIWAPGNWSGERGRWRIWKGKPTIKGRWPCGGGIDSWLPAGQLRRCWGVRENPRALGGPLVVWLQEAKDSGWECATERAVDASKPLGYEGHWRVGSMEEVRRAVLDAAANDRPLIVASDGSVRCYISDEPAEPTSGSAAGWAIGVGLGSDVTGEESGRVRWVAAGGQRVETTSTPQSSFRAEVAGAVMVGRVLRQAVAGTGGQRPRIRHWCDNQGVVAAWTHRPMIKAGGQRSV